MPVWLFLVGLKLEAQTKIREAVSYEPSLWLVWANCYRGDWLPGLVARNSGLTRSLTRR